MPAINREKVTEYVQKHIQEFHANRLTRLKELSLEKILKRKNPYLFKAKNLISAPALVGAILDAHLSSQEEATFGSFLEGLAIFVCQQVYGGGKSSAEGIDLEFYRDGTLYIVSIKSGPNWGNSQQVKRMIQNFKQAKRILGTNTNRKNVIAVNGCCYGREKVYDRGEYLKLCGQEFWKLISGDEEFYIQIIEPIGHQARERNEVFQAEYAQVTTLFTEEFIANFCDNGNIVWSKIIKLNSSADW